MTPPWLLVTGDFVRTGGMDAANFALASYLARHGRETHLVGHRVDAELASLPGVHVHRVWRPFGSHLLGFPLLAAAARLRRGGSNDSARDAIVLANGGNAPGTVTWLHYVHAAYEPRIAGRRTRRVVEHGARRKALRDERRVARNARTVIANSHLTARHAVELLGVDPRRVHTVYYGADPERFSPATAEERSAARRELGLDDEEPVLVFVGALGDRRKGFDTLFGAFAHLHATDPGWDARLVVAGAGGELEEWKRRAVRARLGSQIRFVGFRRDVRRVLAAADVLVSPTRYEAYGLAVHEALLMELPVIVSHSAGVAERIPPSLAPLLIDDPDDPAALAERLLAWRAGLDAYRAGAAMAAAELRGWTWEQMAARIMDIVERGE